MQNPFRIVVDVTGGDPADAATPAAMTTQGPESGIALVEPEPAPAPNAPPADSRLPR